MSYFTQEEIDGVLKIDEFRRWLSELPGEYRLGKTANCIKCPLYKYISTKLFHPEFSLAVFTTCLKEFIVTDKLFELTGAFYTIPEWAKEFQYLINEYEENARRWITAADCLEVLDRL